MHHPRLLPSQPEQKPRAHRWINSRVGPVLVIALGCVILLAAAGRAAELVAAELEGTVNTVTVEQGGSTTFTISVRATGSIRCNATPSNPATAQIPTSFAVAANGAVSAAEASAPLTFFGTGSGTCNVSWSGDPTPYRVTATLRADLFAPLGSRSIRLSPTLFTPGGSGSALRDDTATLLTFSVTPGTDREPPDVTCEGPTGARGDNGWYIEPVAYDCTSVDGGSGLANAADVSFRMETEGEGNVEVGSRAVSDVAGNVRVVGPWGPYDVDLHDPMVDVEEPAEGAAYVLGSRVAPSYACADTPDGSGVRTCSAGEMDTSSVGRKTVTVTSLDAAGRRTVVTRTYDVVYDVTPMDPSGPERAREPGSALSVRWKIEGQSSRSIVRSLSSAEAACDAVEPVAGATPVDGTPVRYEPGTRTFAFTWRTDRSWAGTCRQLQMELDDGTVRTMIVSFKTAAG